MHLAFVCAQLQQVNKEIGNVILKAVHNVGWHSRSLSKFSVLQMVSFTFGITVHLSTQCTIS